MTIANRPHIGIVTGGAQGAELRRMAAVLGARCRYNCVGNESGGGESENAG